MRDFLEELGYEDAQTMGQTILEIIAAQNAYSEQTAKKVLNKC